MEVLHCLLQLLPPADLQEVNEVGHKEVPMCRYIYAQALCAGQPRQSFEDKVCNRLKVIVWQLIARCADDASISEKFDPLEWP